MKDTKKSHRVPPLHGFFGHLAASHPQWEVLTADEAHYLDQAKTVVSYRPGEAVFRQGQAVAGIHILESGVAALRKTDEQGRSLLLKLVCRSGVLGHDAYFGSKVYAVTAEALAPTTVCFLGGGAVREVLQRNTALGDRFLSLMASDVEAANDSVMEHTLLPVRARLASLLVSLKDSFSEVDDQGVMSLTLPTTRQEMAELLGTRAETITRTLNEMVRDGVIGVSGRVVHIPDLDTLLDEIEGR